MGVLLYYKGYRRGEGVSGSCRALLGKWARQAGPLYVQVRQTHFFFFQNGAFKMGLFTYSAACKSLRSASEEVSECTCF